MALALRISVPPLGTHGYGLGDGIVGSCRPRVGPFRRPAFPAIRCSAEKGGDAATEQGGAPDGDGKTNRSGHFHAGAGNVEDYAGWTPLEREDESNRLAGLLRIGASLLLAVGFAVVTYVAYARKGSKHAVVYSVTTHQEQQIPLPSTTSRNEFEDVQKSSELKYSSPPTSDENGKNVQEENPNVLENESDQQRKKISPGQDSFPSEEGTELNDNEDVVSRNLTTFSDEESDEVFSEVNSKAASPVIEEIQSSLESTFPVLKEIQGTDHADQKAVSGDEENVHSDDVDSGSPSADSGSAIPKAEPRAGISAVDASAIPIPPETELHSDEGDAQLSPVNSSVEAKHRDLEDEMVRISSGGDDQDSLPSEGTEQSVVKNRPALEPSSMSVKDEIASTASKEDAGISIFASLVLPKGATESMLESKELEVSFNEDRMNVSASEPVRLENDPSVLGTLSSSLPSEISQSQSVGIPAPSAPSAASQASVGSIIVPAVVDNDQEQALAALQALKVIEQGVEAGGLCSRREYARWLIAITSALARSPAHKVLPAMYIENTSELAFNDVSPDDPDFPYIQGLAEAGLISSNLSRHDSRVEGRSTDGAIFLPDSPVSRQDMVTWKVAFEKRNLDHVDKRTFKSLSGFIDVDRISEEAVPFLATDLNAGERSIVASAFGFTKRFQPDKPVTRGQAAIALITGEAADAVAEEITRLEAEQMAEAAVVAEYALESRAQKQVEEYFNTELKAERELRLTAFKQLEEARDELEKMLQERDSEQNALDRMRASLEAERQVLFKFREEADEQLQIFTAHRVEVGIEKDRFENLRRDLEDEKKTVSELKAALEVEKRALILARNWAEEEASSAREYAKILEKARTHWQSQGIQVVADKELDEQNIPSLPWQYSSSKSSLNRFLKRAPVQDFLDRAGELKGRVLERFYHLVQAVVTILSRLRQRIAESLQGVGSKAQSLRQDATSAINKAAHDAQEVTVNTAKGFSTSVSENTKKIVDNCRGEAQKLSQRFKS